MSVSESSQHKKLKEIIEKKLKEWTGATLKEYSSAGHELDVFAVTPNGVSVYVEIIWSSSPLNFFRDMTMIQESDADVKIVVASPKVMDKADFQRKFEKVAISQRRFNIAMYGSLIDGQRILDDSNYLATEFKTIVTCLINQVNTRGKVMKPKLELEPPKVDTFIKTEEQLVANLFPVSKYPQTIFLSPTYIKSARQAYEELGDKIDKVPFLIKNGNLYTFDDLKQPSSPFLTIISRDEISREEIADWAKDKVKRNDLVSLFNLGLRKYCENRKLYFDKKHRRFVCLLDNGGTNFFGWKPHEKFDYREIAKCIRGEDGKILYCKHYAASLSFILLDGKFFLKIQPTMVFTYDGHRPIRSRKLATLMSRYLSKQYNSENLDLVRFWGKFLSRLDLKISVPMGKDTLEIESNPIELSTDIKSEEENTFEKSFTKFETMFIEEPLLTFGENREYIDPKWGLRAYGPCLYRDRRAIASAIRLGLIGSKESIYLAEKWIERCQSEIQAKKENSLLFQAFPGFTKIFGCELRILPECVEVLTEAEIKQVIQIVDFKQRVRNAAKLILDKISNLREREPRPHLVICALPQSIIDTCGTKKTLFATGSASSKREKEILEMLEEYRRIGQTTLFPIQEEGVLDIIPEASDLRRLIKAQAMILGVPTQLAKPTTFKTSPKGVSLQDDATRAWNFCVALYYKAEGYPWKLAHMKQGTCYVGISFYRDQRYRGRIHASVAQVFTHTGEGLVLKGGRALYDKTNKSPYLSKDSACRLMTEVLNAYKKQMHQLPARLVIHKSSRYRPEELEGFNEAATGIELKDFVAVLDRGIRFMKKDDIYPPARGTIVGIGKDDYVLFTKGWIPFFKTYPGLRVPAPIEIVEHYGDTPLRVLFEEILALTKMNWNSADFCISHPITLAYSREVGKILAYVPEEVVPRPEYLYYM